MCNIPIHILVLNSDQISVYLEQKEKYKFVSEKHIFLSSEQLDIHPCKGNSAVYSSLSLNFLLASDDWVSIEVGRIWLLLPAFPGCLIVHQDEETAL